MSLTNGTHVGPYEILAPVGSGLKRIATLQREPQHRCGCAAHPVGSREFSGWTTEQVWPE